MLPETIEWVAKTHAGNRGAMLDKKHLVRGEAL
jgi:hypothetical protein